MSIFLEAFSDEFEKLAGIDRFLKRFGRKPAPTRRGPLDAAKAVRARVSGGAPPSRFSSSAGLSPRAQAVRAAVGGRLRGPTI